MVSAVKGNNLARTIHDPLLERASQSFVRRHVSRHSTQIFLVEQYGSIRSTKMMAALIAAAALVTELIPQ